MFGFTVSSPFGGLLTLLTITCLAAAAVGGVPVQRKATDILPPETFRDKTGHPLDGKIRAFLEHQASVSDFSETGLTGKDYLRIINGQVRFFRGCQDESGAIIDPVEKIEWQYSTPRAMPCPLRCLQPQGTAAILSCWQPA